MGGTPQHQSVRAYFIGEALAASSDDAGASEAYTRATRDHPGGRWARRAEEKLAAMKPFR
jgi:hypothetical protein